MERGSAPWMRLLDASAQTLSPGASLWTHRAGGRQHYVAQGLG